MQPWGKIAITFTFANHCHHTCLLSPNWGKKWRRKTLWGNTHRFLENLTCGNEDATREAWLWFCGVLHVLLYSPWENVEGNTLKKATEHLFKFATGQSMNHLDSLLFYKNDFAFLQGYLNQFAKWHGINVVNLFPPWKQVLLTPPL